MDHENMRTASREARVFSHSCREKQTVVHARKKSRRNDWRIFLQVSLIK